MKVKGPRGCVIAYSVITFNSELIHLENFSLNRSEEKIYVNNIEIF